MMLNIPQKSGVIGVFQMQSWIIKVCRGRSIAFEKSAEDPESIPEDITTIEMHKGVAGDSVVFTLNGQRSMALCDVEVHACVSPISAAAELAAVGSSASKFLGISSVSSVELPDESFKFSQRRHCCMLGSHYERSVR